MWMIFLIGFGLVAIGWTAYGLYEYKLQKEEKQLKESGKRVKSEHLQEAQKSFDDYVKKMAEFKKPDRSK